MARQRQKPERGLSRVRQIPHRAKPRSPDLSIASQGAAALVQDVDLEGKVKAIVQKWAGLEAEPSGDDLLSVLWAQGHTSADFHHGAADLAQQLNSNLGCSLRPDDIQTDTTVDSLVVIVE